MHRRLLSLTEKSRLLLVSSLIPMACLEASFEDLPLRSVGQEIVSGYYEDGSDSVVYLPGCTGTLIAPNLVLTALHCVAPITGDDNFTCTVDGTLENPPNGQLGAHIDPEDLTVTVGAEYSKNVAARGLRIISTQSTNICQNDLAFIILDRDLEQPISPVRLDVPVQIGEVLSVIGYGLTTNPQDLPPNEVVARRRRDDVPVVAVGSTSSRPEGGEALPRTFALGESVCKGDSGGPAFSEDGAVVGVYSTFVGGCTGPGARNFYTMLSEFRPLVLQAYEEAGANPWLSGQPSPGLDSEPEPDPQEASNQQAISTGYCSVRPLGTGSKPATAMVLILLLALRRRRRKEH